MTLEQAYQQLNLRPPLAFESEQMEACLGKGMPIRGIGTTTRMLVDAALDVLIDQCDVTMRAVLRASALRHRELVLHYVRMLGGGGLSSLDRVHAVTLEANVAGSHRVYTDHCRDVFEDIDVRVTGPFGSARWAQYAASRQVYTIYDRDRVVLGMVTRAGLETLQERHYVQVRVY